MAGMGLNTPAGFLKWGGVILLVLGIVGFLVQRLPPGGAVGVYFTPAENYAHVVLGIVGIGAAYYLSKDVQKMLTLLVALAGFFFGITGLFVFGKSDPLNYYGVTNLELIDDVIHIVVGIWGAWAYTSKK